MTPREATLHKEKMKSKIVFSIRHYIFMGKISLHSIKITKQDCLLISKTKDKAKRISPI